MCSVALFSSLLQSAGESRSIRSGRLIHDRLVRDGDISHPRILSFLIDMYTLCGMPSEAHSSLYSSTQTPKLCSFNILLRALGCNGFVEEAKSVFSEMPYRDVISWTNMISMLSRHGCDREAVQMYHQMVSEGVRPTVVSFVNVVRACGRSRGLIVGTTIHITAIESGFDHIRPDVMLATALVKMYGECGELSLAWIVFSQSKDLDIVAWNTMIFVFLQNRDLCNAIEAFGMAPDRDCATWNTIIGGLTQNGHGNMAFKLFCQMNLESIKPNVVTFISVLNAFTSTACLENSRLVHMLIVESGLDRGIEIENALISTYGRCRDVNDAKSIFENMQCRNVVSWTAIVGGWCESGHFEKALDIFKKMKLHRVPPDKVTLLCALHACAMLSTLEEGKEINETICKLGMEIHSMIQTALIDMYGKCGSVEESRDVFDHSLERTIEMWNALMTTFSQTGCVNDIRKVFMEMQQDNIMPNHVTFSCVLAACSHSGSVDDASRAFLSINTFHGVPHTEDHYLCIVDLFTRTGELEKAEAMVKNLPFQFDEDLAWQCLLSGCKIHNDVERAVHMIMDCINIDPSNVYMYAPLSLFAIFGDNVEVHGNHPVSANLSE